MQQQRVVPDVISYSALISACEKGSHPAQALEAFQDAGVVDPVPLQHGVCLGIVKVALDGAMVAPDIHGCTEHP